MSNLFGGEKDSSYLGHPARPDVSVDQIQIQDARELALSAIMGVKMGENHLLAKPVPCYEF
jgi:hypothetical protein